MRGAACFAQIGGDVFYLCTPPLDVARGAALFGLSVDAPDVADGKVS